MENSSTIGIDPGLGGAIAIINGDNIKLHDMPVMIIPWAKNTSYKKMVDVLELKKIIDRPIKKINIELVHSMPQQGPASTWAFSGAFYSAITVCKMLGHNPNLILPTQWKKKYGLINVNKDYARLIALKMYPQLLSLLKRKKDIDRAESLLIAGY